MTRGLELAAEELAAGSGGAAGGFDSAARVHTRARVHARGLFRNPLADLAGAWWRTAQPADLTTLLAKRRPSGDDVPEGSTPLRWVLGVWIHAVAIPTSFLLLPVARYAGPLRSPLYGLAWVLQRPDRAALAAVLLGPIIFMISKGGVPWPSAD